MGGRGHSYNPSIPEVGIEVEVRAEVHSYNPRTWEAEMEGVNSNPDGLHYR